MSKPLILVDMDEVVANWNGMFETRLKSMLPHIEYIPHHQITSFYAEASYPPEHRNDIMIMMNSPGFYRELEPIEGAIDGVKELAKRYDVMFCSAPLLSHETCASEKLAWIGEHFGLDWTHRLILTSDKTMVRGDILIDDKEDIKGLVEPTWQQVVFDAPYNQNSASPLRVYTWDDVPGVVDGYFADKTIYCLV